MTAVWYLGEADERRITSATWAAAGIVGVPDSVWNASNGWSVPQIQFTAPQLALLQLQQGFNVNAPDGPRPDQHRYDPSDDYATQGYVDEQIEVVEGLIHAGGAPPPITYAVTAISTWNQVHTFPYPPSVRLIDPSGEWVDIGVEYPNPTTVHISFPTPFTGTIILS